jgi:hypothetical protein
MRGGSEEGFPPVVRNFRTTGHKSNSLVLNEAAQRLGVSLRQTEDQLMRDMLASTASFINCVNGSDGRQNRIIAVTKSSLIDLELLAA